MDLNRKFAKALDDTLDFKGVTVLDRQLKTLICLDEENENFEVGIHCTAMDGNSFLSLISDMLKKVKLNLSLKKTMIL